MNSDVELALLNKQAEDGGDRDMDSKCKESTEECPASNGNSKDHVPERPKWTSIERFGEFITLFMKLSMVMLTICLTVFDTLTDFKLALKFLNFNGSAHGNIDSMAERLDMYNVGVLTMVILFLPTIIGWLGNLIAIKKIIDRSKSIKSLMPFLFFLAPLFVLPGIQILTNTALAIFLIYNLINDYRQSLKTTQKDLKRKPTDYAETFVHFKSFLTLTKTAEILGESFPQLIFQIVVLLIVAPNLQSTWTYLMNDYEQSTFLSATLITILTSWANLIHTSASLLCESFFIINGVGASPSMSFLDMRLITFSMVFVIVPRILAISLIIASFTFEYSLIAAVCILASFMLGFVIIYENLKKENEFHDPIGYTNFGLVLMAISSIFAPSALINPKWTLLDKVSKLSGSLLMAGMTALICCCIGAPRLLRPSLIEDPWFFNFICASVFCGLYISMDITSWQCRFIFEKHLKLFEYQVIFGETTLVEENLKSDEEIETWLFPTACKFNHQEIVSLFLQYGKAKNVDFNVMRDGGWTGYMRVCATPVSKNDNIKRMIEEKADELDIDTKINDNARNLKFLNWT